MITTTVYHRQIDRIEGAFNYKIDSNALHVWQEELNKNNITDSDLIAAVNSGLSKGGWEIRPHLGALLTKCHFAKQERMKAAQRRIQKEEELADKPLKDLLSRDRAKSPFSQKLCENLHDMFEDKIDVATFKQRDMEIKAQRTTG